MKRLAIFRRWRPIQLPPLRDLVAGAAIYAALFALGWSLATGDPRAALAFAALLLALSWLLERNPNTQPSKGANQ